MADTAALTALDHARLLRMLLARAIHLSDVARARRVVDEATAVDSDDRAEHNRRVAADRITAEADLFTARARSWDATGREDLAATYGLALTWQRHSLLARDVATGLRDHLRHRHGESARDLHRQWDTAMAQARAREPVPRPTSQTPAAKAPPSVIASLVAAAHPHAASPAGPAHPSATPAATPHRRDRRPRSRRRRPSPATDPFPLTTSEGSPL